MEIAFCVAVILTCWSTGIWIINKGLQNDARSVPTRPVRLDTITLPTDHEGLV